MLIFNELRLKILKTGIDKHLNLYGTCTKRNLGVSEEKGV